MPRLNRNDYLFMLAAAAVISLLAYLIYRHSRQRGILSEDLRPVGVVEYRYREVLRKFSDRMMWEGLETDEEVYLYDSIMTNNESDVKITMQNGLKIQIDPNSMVEIDMTGNTANIALRGGVLHTESAAGTQAVVTTADGTRIDLKNAHARITSGEDSSELAVLEGNARVDRAGQRYQLNPGELLSRDAGGKVNKRKFAIRLVNPEDGIVVTEPDVPVAFQWQTPSPTDRCSVQLRDAAGATRKLTARGNSVSRALPSGTYIWQVSCETASTRAAVVSSLNESPEATLRVRPAAKLHVVYPHTGEKIPRNQAEDLVFRWDIPGADDVVLSTFSLSQKEDFTDVLMTTDSSSGIVKPGPLKPGKYYWKVEPKTQKKYKPLVSRFTISPQSDFLPYADPRADKRIWIEPDANEAYAHLIWKYPGTERAFNVTIAKDMEFNRVLRKIETRDMAVTTVLPAGKYYWKIGVYDNNRRLLLHSSKPALLEIRRKELPRPPRVKSVIVGP